MLMHEKTCDPYSKYCKFKNFHENFICDVKKLQLEHDLPTSVNGRVILPFWRVIFPETLQTLVKFSEFTVELVKLLRITRIK